MARFKLACLAVICFMLLLPSLVSAENHYTSAMDGITPFDSTSSCGVNQQTCWSLITQSPILTQVSVGRDSTLYGLDASGNLWTLPYATNVWQSSALSPMEEIAVASSANVYGLVTKTGYCALPEKRVYQYTGGVDFVALNACAVHIAVSSDGSMYRIRSSGNVGHLANNGLWVQDTTASASAGHGTPVHLSVGSAANVWVVTSTNTILHLDPNTGNFVVVPGVAYDVATSGVDSATAETWIIGPTVGNGNLSRYNYSTSTWTQMFGILSSVSTGGHKLTFGLGPHGSTFHFNTIGFSVSASMKGYFDCNSFVQGCPAGSLHTAYQSVAFLSGGVPQNATGSSGSPAANISASSFGAFTTNCDPVFGDPSSLFCQFNSTSRVVCKAMGVIWSVVTLVKIQEELATTRVIWTVGTPVTNCSGTVEKTCDFQVTEWCTIATTPPDMNILQVRDLKIPFSFNAWDVNGECTRASFPGGHTPWVCIPFEATEIAVAGSPAPPLGQCTHNP